MDSFGAQAFGLERGDLVFHQGDERADDQRRATAREAGELVAQRLAGARRHDQEHVFTGGRGFASGLLVRTVGGEAEGVPEQRGEIALA